MNTFHRSTLSTFYQCIRSFLTLFSVVASFQMSGLIGIIKPVNKNKGDPTQPDDYRHNFIYLSSCLGKLFTSILGNRLIACTNETNLNHLIF